MPALLAAEAEEPTSDEDEDGVPRPRLGTGVLGTGPLVKVSLGGKVRDFDDGAGLCSPGRWRPDRRNPERSGLALCLRDRLFGLLRDTDLKALFFSLAAGKLTLPPFSDELMLHARALIRS